MMFATIKSKTILIILLMIPMIVSSGIIFYKQTNDIYENKFLGLKSAAEGVKISKSFEKNIIQIQQWLTDISATRAAEGYDDGYTEAEKHFGLAKKDLGHLKELGLISEDQHDEIFAKLSSFYETGKKMAHLYIHEGPSGGNAFMGSFDTESEKLQESLGPLLESLNKRESDLYLSSEYALAQIRKTVVIVFVVILLYVSLGLILLGRSIISNLNRVTNTIKESSKELRIESDAVGRSSVQLSEAANEQASGLQETVSSVDEISSMVQRNADSANSSTQVSLNSTEAASRGKKIVESMITSIREISSSNETIMKEVQEGNNEISKIVTMISEIGEKTKVINDIVFQTKLLSFNASVEAARAGEHGKGFAVVAEEVGNLASMSGKAAQQITEMLDRSTKQVTAIVDSTKVNIESLMRKGKEKVEAGAQTAEKCGEALDEILQNVSSVNEMIREISTASSEQAAGVHQITKAMQELDKTTHQNSSIANSSLVMAKRLEQHSQVLNSAVSELVKIVGQSVDSERVSETSQRDEKENDNVIDLPSSNTAVVKNENQGMGNQGIKVAGLDTEIPDESDERFEDL